MACVGVTAFANDHITSRSYWQDETEQATLEQAQSQRYEAFEGVLSRGYTKSPIWIRLTITPPKDLLKYVVEKGSITIDGTSLTVSAVTDTTFSVSLIPATLEKTTLGIRQVGDRVNLEVDVLAKYVEKLVAAQ